MLQHLFPIVIWGLLASLQAEAPATAAEPDPLELRIQQHPILGKLGLERVDTWAPARLWVEPPDKPERGWQTGMAGPLGPWLAQLSQMFERHVATPAELQADATRPAPAVVVLQSQQHFEAFSRQAGAALEPDPYAGGAFFDLSSGLVVTHRAYVVQGDMRQGRHAPLHAVVHQLQHRHAGAERTPVAWIDEGIANTLTIEGPGIVKPLTELDLNWAIADRCLKLLGDAERRELYWHPLAALMQFSYHIDVLAEVRARAEITGQRSDDKQALEAFLDQAYLLTWWSSREAPDRWRRAYHNFVGDLHRGESAAEARRANFDGFTLGPIEEQFEQWIRRAALDGVASSGFRAPHEDQGQAQDEAPIVHEFFPTTDLELQIEEVEAWLCRALARAERGELGRAMSELDQLAAVGLSGELADRLSRERERVQGLSKLRERVLSEHQSSGKALRAELDGRRHMLHIRAVEPDRILLTADEDEPGELPKDRLSPQVIVDQASPAALAEAGSWAQAWAECFRGDSRWKRRLVKAREPSEVELKADAQNWYPHARLVGRAALALADLRELADYESPSEAQDFVNALQVLWQESSEVDCVKSRTAPMRGLARAAYALLSEGLSPVDHLNGQVTLLEDDLVRVHYDFETPEQESDFRSDITYLAAYRSANGPLVAEGHPDALHVSKGSLRGSGRALMRHVLEFQAPLKVDWKVRYRHGKAGDQGKIVYALGLCGDRLERTILASIFGWLRLILPGGRVQLYKPEADPLIWAVHEYVFSFEHDGDELKYVRDGKGSATTGGSAHGLTEGRVFVFLHSDHEVWLTELTIEGKVGTQALENRRRSWVAEQVEALGLQ